MIDYIKEHPEVAAATITAAIGILAAFVSAIVSLTISKQSSYIVAVTAERSKWIDKLRENIAELLGTCSAICLTSSDKASLEALAKREKADRLIALITMQLNPNNPIDENMISMLPKLVDAAQKEKNGYRGLEIQFVRYAQFLLKEEWEKVKSEAMGTLLYLLKFRRCKRLKREADYQKFLNKKQSEKVTGFCTFVDYLLAIFLR